MWAFCKLKMMRGAPATFMLFMAVSGAAQPIGKLVDIGGRSLHIVCMGSGPHTVVMESGAAVGFYEWWLVQSALRDDIRTCSYDRAGFGWSDPPPSRSIAGYVKDLHELLQRRGEAAIYFRRSLDGRAHRATLLLAVSVRRCRHHPR